MKYLHLFVTSLALLIITSCNNDYRPEYQKDLLYDGLKYAVDTVNIKTYNAVTVDGVATKENLQSSITKWYDINGYHSMTVSRVYTPQGERLTTEKITRDKNSLPIARDIVIETPNAEAAVTLARLKRRKEGKEEWLFRHYFDPKRYLEDASTTFYTENSRTIKKQIGESDSLNVIEVEVFDTDRRSISRQSMQENSKHPHIKTSYNNGYIDSIVISTNDGKKEVETYKYQYDSKGNPIASEILRNDTLIFITETVYGYRL